MLGLAAIPGVLLAVGMWFMPESPRWLIKQGRHRDARAVLVQIDPHGDADAALAQLERDLAAEGHGTWDELLHRPLRAGIGTINVLATFIAIWLVDRAGRKPLLIAGIVGMVATLAVLGLAFRDAGTDAGIGRLAVITVVCLAAYIVFFAFSLGPIVWLMISEIYPLRNRAHAVAVSTAANWGANFLVSLSFPVMTARLGTSLTFLIYAALGVLALWFTVARVPETKGKTLEEISALWR